MKRKLHSADRHWGDDGKKYYEYFSSALYTFTDLQNRFYVIFFFIKLSL